MSRLLGMIQGGLIGDAYAAPLEFAGTDRIRREAPELDRLFRPGALSEAEWDDLESSFALRPFGAIRPRNESFGAWEIMAPAGAVTDDSRQKIMALRALELARTRGAAEPEAADLAEAALRLGAEWGGKFGEEIVEDGLSPLLGPARWMTGDRSRPGALPPELALDARPSCMGLMTTTLWSAAFAGQPEAAYRCIVEHDWSSNGAAKDITAAVTAALAASIGGKAGSLDEFERVMEQTDPFGLRNTRWVSRGLLVWIWAAEEACRRAEGCPVRLFKILEEDSQAETWWEAHVVLFHALTMLRFAKERPLAALMVAAAFGHDSDSTGQLIGQIAGALYGAEIWPENVWEPVRQGMIRLYEEDPESWPSRLAST
jgi:hypothetical protein